ncbi:Alternative oxidase 1a, mitochondrial [Hordeum vulgare]|nr:Alternative oxidase 1a, mitochondrial [Hordeum vulgare]
MDATAGTLLTPSYIRDSSDAAVAAAAANPSAGSFGFAAAATPPSTGVARGLFMPPRMTSVAGGLAPAPAVYPRVRLLQLSNIARAKKGKVSGKKKKEADGSGSSKPSRKRLAGHVTAAVALKGSPSSLVETPPNGQKVFEEMHQSVNDEAYISTMGVGSNNSHWSQTNDMHFDDHEFDVDEDGEGIVHALKGRGGNYTNGEDIFLCNTWFQVSRDPSIGGEEKKTKKGNIKKGRPFTLPRCYEELKGDEKWKKRDGIDDVDESNKRKKTIELDHDDEEASSDDGKRIPTPNSVSYSKPKRLDGCKKDAKEKKKRKGDDELKNAMEAIVKARKEANEVRKMARTQDAAAEDRRLATEERRVAAEERKVTLEERRVAMEERSRLLEWEKYLFFLDTYTLNEAQKEYIYLTPEEVLIQKRVTLRSMGGGGIGGMGGGGIGGMGGFGAPPRGIRGMGGGGMGGMGGMDGFGAPPVGIGGMGGGVIGGM